MNNKNIFEKNYEEAKTLSPLVLAYIGDCVFDLIVKKSLILNSNYNTKKLHKKVSEIVCCKAQAKYIENLKEDLTQEEILIYKRGRNANSSHKPKFATRFQYQQATGFEALIGYLYLIGKEDRINELFEKANVFNN